MELNKNLTKWGKRISSGDIFEVPIRNNQTKCFFQFLFKDDYYMAGHLIRAFNFEVEIDRLLDLNQIVQNGIKFYTYTRVLQGLKDNLWIKIGNVELPEDYKPPFLRRSADIGMNISVSDKWIKLLPGTNYEEFIGELNDESRKLDYARIYPPSAIVRWLETGSHGFKIID